MTRKSTALVRSCRSCGYGATAAYRRAQPISDAVCATRITTEELSKLAATAIGQLAAMEEQIGDVQDGYDAAPKAALAYHKTIFGPPRKAYLKAIAHLKAEVKVHVEQSRIAYQAALVAAAHAAPAIAATEVKAALGIACPVPTGLRERESWAWKITDSDAIPRDYWILDEARLDREVREQKGALAVPGIAPVRDMIMVRG
jgi:hypothetical protein